MSRSIADILGKNYRDEIDFDETVRILARDLHKHELAYFIVDAKNRGWIPNQTHIGKSSASAIITATTRLICSGGIRYAGNVLVGQYDCATGQGWSAES